MATNFEVYKDEIQKCLSENNIAIKNNKPVKCVGDCNSCIRDSGIGICMDKPLFEWLYAEHIEQPKLTKRERAFCEIVGNKVIARDEDGELNLFWNTVDIYKYKPYGGNGRWLKKTPHSNHITIDNKAFSFIKWSDEKPWAIEDLLKLKVIEEVQEDA